MTINEKIPTLNREQELKLLKTAKNSKNKVEKNRAIRLLIAFNQPFVKYIVHGYSYSRKEIDPRDLVHQGIEATLQAIGNFDLVKAEKFNYRFATYAGYWIRQYIQAFIRRNQILPRSVEKPEPSELEWEEEKVNSAKYSVVYYDREYQSSEKDDKASLLMDTLSEDNQEEEVWQSDSKKQVQNLLTNLEPKENLITRLFFALTPTNLAQIYPLLNAEKKASLEKLKVGKKLENTSLIQKKKAPLVNKCLELFATVRKKEEVAREISKMDFWQYFTFRSEKDNPSLVIEQAEKEKWLKKGIKEKDISFWVNLGYQSEDTDDERNHILQNIGISKKERERWKKLKVKPKNKDWFEHGLEKLVDNWKKKILIELGKVLQNKQGK